MTEKDFPEIHSICMDLTELLKKYGENQYYNQILILYDIIRCIDCSTLKSDEKIRFILKSYKKLYPEEGGLNEFFIHENDFRKRIELNKISKDKQKRLLDIIGYDIIL